MKNFFKLFTLFFIFLMTIFQTYCQQREIAALEMLKQCSDVSIPDKVSVERFATLNAHGYIFFITSPIAQEFIREASPEKKLLEIGAGFSETAQKCLSKKVLEYTANDLSLDHLKIMCKRLQNFFGEEAPSYLKHLQFLPGRAPEVLTAQDNYYDGILLDKVLHFFCPEEVESFLTWAHKALKPNGKIFILNISPYCSGFNVQELYLAQKENLGVYAGYVKNMQQHLQVSDDLNPNYKIPNTTLFFMLDDLKKVLEDKKFFIEKTFSVKLPRQEKPIWTTSEEEQCDLIGIIAHPIKN